jgi:hypothetical protein
MSLNQTMIFGEMSSTQNDAQIIYPRERLTNG